LSSSRLSLPRKSEMRDPLNFFEPYERLPAGHENQLTRAFLVTLRLVPLAHTVWLRRVNDSRPPGAPPLPHLDQLPIPTFQTQTGQIGPTTPQAVDTDESNSSFKAISVFQAGELAPNEEDAEPSDRRAIFDGVVRYEDELALIIESKLDGRFDEQQAKQITIGETAWQVDPARARMKWRDIIADWRELIRRELVSGAELKVLEDFMWLVQRNFARLQPFSDLDACQGNEYLLKLRCTALLEEMGSTEVELRATAAIALLPKAKTVKLVALEPHADPDTIRLRLWPGDTLEQAKLLYEGRMNVDKLLKLRDEGWTVSPNFHFGHMTKGFSHMQGEITADEYVDYWMDHIRAARQVQRSEWMGYFDELVDLGIAALADREVFQRDFVDTKRNLATPRPGLYVERSWTLGAAAGLDSRQQFAKEVRTAINSVLETLGELRI
jgi:hypothetical protein